MRVVVTGGAGFIGANLVRRLRNDVRFDEVMVIDDLSTGSLDNLEGIEGFDPGTHLRVGSVLDADLLDEVVAGADAIVHLAARPSVPRSIEDPVATHHANATGTLAVLEAARAHARPADPHLHVIVASSSSVYGANPRLPKVEDLRTQPLSPYAVSKLATESYALAYAHCYGMPTLAFRFFNVFGPLQAAGHAYAAVIPAFLDAALQGAPIPVHGDGSQTRDFTYVGTVTNVITEALARRATSPDPVNLAFGTRRSLMDVVADIGGLLGREPQVEYHPTRPGDVPHSQAGDARLRALFPDAEPVPFSQGLRATVDWFHSLPKYA